MAIDAAAGQAPATITVEVARVCNVPLRPNSAVRIHWRYGKQEGLTRPTLVLADECAPFEQTLTINHDPFAMIGGRRKAPPSLQLTLEHLVSSHDARVVDRLVLQVEAVKPLCGRLGIVSPKLLVFDLSWVAKVQHPVQSEPWRERRRLTLEELQLTSRRSSASDEAQQKLHLVELHLQQEKLRSRKLKQEIKFFHMLSGQAGSSDPTSTPTSTSSEAAAGDGGPSHTPSDASGVGPPPRACHDCVIA